MNKKCSKCKTERGFDEFHKNKCQEDGFSHVCKLCRKLDRINNLQKYRERDKLNNIKFKIQKQEYRDRRKQISKEYNKNLYAKDKERIDKRNKAWRKKNKNWFKDYMTERCKEINFRIAKNLRTRLYHAIKYKWKFGSAVSDLGCSIEEFKRWIESKFKPGMSWDNYGKNGWHIDHIIPLSCFHNLGNDREQFLKACHYTNLQPMWWRENISKGGRDLNV